MCQVPNQGGGFQMPSRNQPMFGPQKSRINNVAPEMNASAIYTPPGQWTPPPRPDFLPDPLNSAPPPPSPGQPPPPSAPGGRQTVGQMNDIMAQVRANSPSAQAQRQTPESLRDPTTGQLPYGLNANQFVQTARGPQVDSGHWQNVMQQQGPFSQGNFLSPDSTRSVGTGDRFSGMRGDQPFINGWASDPIVSPWRQMANRYPGQPNNFAPPPGFEAWLASRGRP